MMPLSPHAITFCLLSFEGPDRYALAGGLGVRITHLAETLAERGFETHLIFVGDPNEPGRETQKDGCLTLHRWGQWISAYHSAGVYDGKESKLFDFNEADPPFIIEQIIKPALAHGRLPVILAEEWHTAEVLIRLHDQLDAIGLAQHCVLLWNANNTMSFHRVDWLRLNQVAQITTVSRYMKHLMWEMDLNPLVIPNGIPSEMLHPVPTEPTDTVRTIGIFTAVLRCCRCRPGQQWSRTVWPGRVGSNGRRGIGFHRNYRRGVHAGWPMRRRPGYRRADRDCESGIGHQGQPAARQRHARGGPQPRRRLHLGTNH